jgi:hypothetical protein
VKARVYRYWDLRLYRGSALSRDRLRSARLQVSATLG